MNAFAGVLDRFVRAVAAGDGFSAARCLSPSFGIHEGRTASGWIAHELREFGKRSRAFGLDEGLSVELLGHRCRDLRAFVVLDRYGRLVYQDAVRMAGDGLIAGSGRESEIVTKLSFSRSGVRRGMAVRTPRGLIDSIIPINLIVDEFELRSGAGFAEDGFQIANFTVRDDHLESRAAKFSLRAGRSRETVEVWLRGIDDPFFVGSLDPQFEGGAVYLASKGMRYWSLSVLLADGRSLVVDHPDRQEYRFDAPVIRAVLTDALDNDWCAEPDLPDAG